jgi:hypothetical protein
VRVTNGFEGWKRESRAEWGEGRYEISFSASEDGKDRASRGAAMLNMLRVCRSGRPFVAFCTNYFGPIC